MKYAIEMGSGAMLYIPNFVKFFCRHSKVNMGGFTETDSMEIALAYFRKAG
jgi:hypothetical protein